MKISSAPPEDQAKPSGSRTTAALLVVALVLLGAFIIAVPYAPAALQAGVDIFSQLASSLTQPGSNVTNHSYSPLIQNGSADIQFPSDYSTLASYALQLVNWDRANFSVAPVTLSNNSAGQQHADSMLRYNYFSHFDTQGFKPYMRYTLLTGVGADAENVAYISDPSAHYTTSTVMQAISTLEHAMVYDDVACCNNGHRDNILDPLHNKVSIGVAYDSTHVYFDEEFENDYIVPLTYSVSSSNVVSMSGTSIQTSVTDKVNSIYIAYDPTPQSQTPTQLNNGPHEYGPGTLIGGVLKGDVLGNCGQFSSGVTVCATTWSFSSSQVNVVFSLQPFIDQYGAGVYTIYMITGHDTNSALTTISIFVA